MPMLPFRLWATPRAITDLHARLDAARWPLVPLHDAAGGGADDLRLRDLVARWRFAFDWPAAVACWNTRAHVRGPVGAEGSTELHALLAAPAPEARRPDDASAPSAVLLLPAWPRCFTTELGLVDALTASGYEVVVPSMPGTGFSDPVRVRGWGGADTAVALARLMAGFGHRRYAMHAAVEHRALAGHLVASAGGAVWGVHIDATGPLAPATAPLTAEAAATLAYALHDSPLGLLAWMQPLADRWGWEDEDILRVTTLHWMTGAARGGLASLVPTTAAPPADDRAHWRETTAVDGSIADPLLAFLRSAGGAAG